MYHESLPLLVIVQPAVPAPSAIEVPLPSPSTATSTCGVRVFDRLPCLTHVFRPALGTRRLGQLGRQDGGRRRLAFKHRPVAASSSTRTCTLVPTPTP